MANNISKDRLIASLEQMSSESQNSVSTNNEYQIIGDNCDLHVNVQCALPFKKCFKTLIFIVTVRL